MGAVTGGIKTEGNRQPPLPRGQTNACSADAAGIWRVARPAAYALHAIDAVQRSGL